MSFTIRSYAPMAAIRWLKQGIGLYKKQFIRFSLLFMFVSTLSFLSVIDPLIGLLLGLISVPLSQMLLFNAAYGTQRRGYFQISDLRQKLNTAKIWARLLLATIINLFVVYFILFLTLPSLPISMEAFLNLPSTEMQAILEKTYTLPVLASTFFCIGVYLLLSFWVYPLICWEELAIFQAFIQSIKATMSNALGLSLLVILFIGISFVGVLITQSFIFLSVAIAQTLMIFVINSIIVALYLSLFRAYMEIFYGESNNIA